MSTGLGASLVAGGGEGLGVGIDFMWVGGSVFLVDKEGEDLGVGSVVG